MTEKQSNELVNDKTHEDSDDSDEQRQLQQQLYVQLNADQRSNFDKIIGKNIC